VKRSPMKRSTKPMKRTELKRGTSVLKRTPIKRRKSQRQAEYDEELEVMRPLVIERSGGYCEALRLAMQTVEGIVGHGGYADGDLGRAFGEFADQQYECLGDAAHIHHRKYRGNSRGGTNALDNLLHVCGSCHRWIHAHGGAGQPANLLGLALTAEESEEL
jgi:HNH endonuclease